MHSGRSFKVHPVCFPKMNFQQARILQNFYIVEYLLPLKSLFVNRYSLFHLPTKAEAPIFAPYGHELFFINTFGLLKNKGMKGGRSPTEIPLF